MQNLVLLKIFLTVINMLIDPKCMTVVNLMAVTSCTPKGK